MNDGLNWLAIRGALIVGVAFGGLLGVILGALFALERGVSLACVLFGAA